MQLKQLKTFSNNQTIPMNETTNTVQNYAQNAN